MGQTKHRYVCKLNRIIDGEAALPLQLDKSLELEFCDFVHGYHALDEDTSNVSA
eukprot:COSAG02_NODE_66452_length_255_cov_0.820513_1_plen_53_part_01